MPSTDSSVPLGHSVPIVAIVSSRVSTFVAPSQSSDVANMFFMTFTLSHLCLLLLNLSLVLLRLL